MYVASSKHSNGADWLTTLSIQPAMIRAGSKATVEAVALLTLVLWLASTAPESKHSMPLAIFCVACVRLLEQGLSPSSGEHRAHISMGFRALHFHGGACLLLFPGA